MPGYGNPGSDPLTFGLSAGGASNANFGAPSWLGMYNYGPGGTGVRKSPTAAAGSGLKFDLGSATDIKNISDLINNINLSATKAAQAARIPDNPALEAQSSKNIGADLAGQVDPDVLNLLKQQSAERGISGGGTTNSPNANAAYLQALGLTSYGLKRQGQTELTAADARNPQAPIVDPSKFTLTPDQAAQLELGYQTEADRVAEENRRLALEASRGGGGGGGRGGYGYYGGTSTGSSPYEYGSPGEYAYGSPSTTTLSSGQPTLNPTFNQNQWLASLGNYQNLDPETGLPLSPVDYSGFGQGGYE